MIWYISLHSIPSATFTAFGTAAESPMILHAVGLERGSVRFPLDCSAGHAISARKALLEECASVMANTGVRIAIETARTVCNYYVGLTYAQRLAQAADLEVACTGIDPLAAQMAGFLSACCEGSGI